MSEDTEQLHGVARDLNQLMGTVTAQGKANDEKFDRILSALYGNGGKGIKERMAAFDVRLDEVEKDAEVAAEMVRDDAVSKRQVSAIVAAIVATGVGLREGLGRLFS